MVGVRSGIEESQRRFQSILTETLGLDTETLIHQALSQEMIFTALIVGV